MVLRLGFEGRWRGRRYRLRLCGRCRLGFGAVVAVVVVMMMLAPW